jgi:hypothetical protein
MAAALNDRYGGRPDGSSAIPRMPAIGALPTPEDHRLVDC